MDRLRVVRMTAPLLFGVLGLWGRAAEAAVDNANLSPDAICKLSSLFQKNMGQAPADAAFVTASGRCSLLIAKNGGMTTLPRGAGWNGQPLRMEFVGSHQSPLVTGTHRTPTRVMHLRPTKPHGSRLLETPAYEKVRCNNLYRGVDLEYYSQSNRLEYDFHIAAGADYRSIGMRFPGASGLAITRSGDLKIDAGFGSVVHRHPVAYQVTRGGKRFVSVQFVLRRAPSESGPEVGFKVASYNPGLPLVIDPVLDFATFLGGSGADHAEAVAVDAEGAVYVTGGTASSDFPTVDPSIPTTAGNEDVFIVKFKPDGRTLEYATYFGGAGNEAGLAIQVDRRGRNATPGEDPGVVITGRTASSNLPILPNATQTQYGGGDSDAFLLHLDPSGRPDYASFLGGAEADEGAGIAVSRADRNLVLIAGKTKSAQIPAQTVIGAAGGDWDGFVAAVSLGDAAGTRLRYLGGPAVDEATAIVTEDQSNAIYVGGWTASASFQPALPHENGPKGGEAGFVVRLREPDLDVLYASAIDGSGADRVYGVAARGLEAFITGSTTSNDLPLPLATPPLQPSPGGSTEAFFLVLNREGEVRYGTYLGGSDGDEGRGISVAEGTELPVVYLAGTTKSPDLKLREPVRGYGGDEDAFLARLEGIAGSPGFQLSCLTYLGGKLKDQSHAVAASDDGNKGTIVGLTLSGGAVAREAFPIRAERAVQPDLRDASGDAFIARLDIRSKGRLHVNRDALRFGNHRPGEASSQFLRVSNRSQGALEVIVGTPASPYSLVDGPARGAIYLAPKEVRLIRIRFQPATPGDYKSVITLSTSRQVKRIKLVGKSRR